MPSKGVSVQQRLSTQPRTESDSGILHTLTPKSLQFRVDASLSDFQSFNVEAAAQVRSTSKVRGA